MVIMPLFTFSQVYKYADTITLTTGGGTKNIAISANKTNYVIYGSGTLTSNWVIQPTGSYLFGTEIYFQYKANITLNGNAITIFGRSLTEYEASSDMIIKGVYDGSSWNTIVTYEPGVYSYINGDTVFIGNDTVVSGTQYWQLLGMNLSPVNTSYKLGIGTLLPSQALDVIGAVELENTTTSATGVIYKGSQYFLHNFSSSGAGFNTFVGKLSGNFTMGAGAIQNVGVGYNSLYALTSGSNNIGIGSTAGATITSGVANTAIGGAGCLDATTTASYNTAIGGAAMTENITGGSNTAIGYRALRENISGKDNVAVGYTSGTVSTGDSNIFIGSSAGNTLVNGNNCILIGTNIQPDDVSSDYQINIGSAIYTNSDLDLYLNSRNDTIVTTDTMLTSVISSTGYIDADKYIVSTGISTIASASTITLDNYNHYIVTGTADIDSIDVASNIPSGTVIHLIFTETAVTNGAVDGANLKLSGDFGYDPDDVLTLIREEDDFYEISRSAN